MVEGREVLKRVGATKGTVQMAVRCQTAGEMSRPRLARIVKLLSDYKFHREREILTLIRLYVHQYHMVCGMSCLLNLIIRNAPTEMFEEYCKYCTILYLVCLYVISYRQSRQAQ